MRKNLTELVFILDRSGSMQGLEADTIGGFNAMIARQKEAAGEALVSTILFDDVSELLHDRVDSKAVPTMTDAEYTVRGCTALIDAIGSTVERIGTIHTYARPEDVPEHTLFVITTDGMENASHRYSIEQVREMIEQKKRDCGWEFLFLGANIDAAKEAGRIGITEDYAATYVPDSMGSAVMYEAMANATCAMRSAPQTKRGKLGSFWKKSVEADHKARG